MVINFCVSWHSIIDVVPLAFVENQFITYLADPLTYYGVIFAKATLPDEASPLSEHMNGQP